MLPYQIGLLTMTLALLAVMMVSAVVSAYLFRNVWNWPFVIGSFVVAIALIFVAVAVAATNNPVFIFPVAALFGASIGATLGSFVIAVTHGKRRGAEAVMVTLAIIAVVTLITAIIGLLSGFNFQGMGGIMFAILLGIVVLSLIGLFVRWNKVVEMVIGLGVALFFMVYMVYDFNKVVDKYDQASWGAAMEIAMNLFLDIVNIFIRLLPIIVELMENTD